MRFSSWTTRSASLRLAATTVLLLFGLVLTGCDSSGADSSNGDSVSRPWLSDWQMLSETTRDIEGIGRIETIYADLGIRKYWVLQSDHTIELSNVEGVEDCARVRSNVTDIGEATMTVDNGVYVFTIEYEVTGDELVATIVDSDELDAIGVSWKGRATDGDPYELAGCQ